MLDLVNLRDNYDPVLLERVYYEIVSVYFPNPDELDSLDDFKLGLQDSNSSVLLYVLVLSHFDCLVGTIIFEHYTNSNTGLISYIVVLPDFRSKGLTKRLMKACLLLLEKCKVVFAETHQQGVIDGTIDPLLRHTILSKLGFYYLACPYIQPPLSEKQSPGKNLLLLSYGNARVSTTTVMDFLDDFGESVAYSDNWKSCLWYTSQRLWLTSHKIIQPLELPWIAYQYCSTVIVGAGAAGLNAARVLCDSCIDTIVVESTDRIGGRIREITLAGIIVDLGAEFIHGTTSGEHNSLVSEGELQLQPTFDLERNRGVHMWNRNLNAFDPHTVECFTRICERPWMSADIPLSQWISEHECTNPVCDPGMIEVVYAQTHASSKNFYGVKEAIREELNWTYGTNNARIAGGMMRLVDYLYSRFNGPLLLNTAVRSISAKSCGTVVECSQTTSIFCDTVLITVPVSEITSIAFAPKLPIAKLNAIDSINEFRAGKVILVVDKCFWDEDQEILFCPVGGPASQIWFRREENGMGVVTGFLAGGLFSTASNDSELQFTQQLEEIFNYKVSQFIVASSAQFSMGYSSPSVGATRGHRADLFAPVNNTIFFAGEATHSRVSGTIQSALESGHEAATSIIQHLTMV